MKLILALDILGSPESVLDEAARWADRLDATLDLLFVEEEPIGLGYVQDPAARQILLREWDNRQGLDRDRLEALQARLPEARRGTILMSTGRPADVIVESARDHDAILIATHGRTGIEHLWLGSVAERVVRRSPVPVIVLRTTDD